MRCTANSFRFVTVQRCKASSSGQSSTPLLGLGAQEQEPGKDSVNLEYRASNIVLCEYLTCSLSTLVFDSTTMFFLRLTLCQ